MTSHPSRPWLRGRRWDPMRTLGAALCIGSALVMGALIVAALALLPSVVRP